MDLTQLNYLAILVCVLASIIIGMLWYSPVLFGKAWMRLVGIDPDQMGSPAKGYVFSIVAAFVQALVLALAIQAAGITTIFWGMMAGLILGLGFTASSFLQAYVFEGKPAKLYFINVGYQVVILVVMGFILGIWQ